MEKKSFTQLGVLTELEEALNRQEIFEPTRVQEEVILVALEGNDVICQAPTGSGKTLAYLLPLLTKIDEKSKELQVIILAPTRELAMQIFKVAKEIGSDQLTMAALVGGANITRQIDALKKKPQLAIGTPGRVLELIQKRKINGQQIKAIVIDEADKMLAFGFKQDIMAVIKATLKERQLLLFSATISKEIKVMAKNIMNNSQMVDLTNKNRTAETIKHGYILAEEKNKTETLKRFVEIVKAEKVIVFINHNEGVFPLVNRFKELGLSAEAMHSDLSQLDRKNILEQFRRGQFKLLVTTDIFARGMDIEGVDYVVNFDVPQDEEYYIHRVGRTGRAGNKGNAITLVTKQQQFIMFKYEKQLNIKIYHYGLGDNKIMDIETIVARKKQEKGRS